MILELQNITKSFGSTRAVDNVSFSLVQGDHLAIVGESGCGKTSLAKIILGLVKADEGLLKVKPLSVQMVFQDPQHSLDPLWTVRSILKEALWKRSGVSFSQQQFMMEEVLKAVDLSADVLGRYPHEFSGGERQRIAIARALLASPKILILDEAVSALDTLVARQIIQLLKKLKKEFNLTYIFISHNLRIVRDFSDKIMVMKDGHMIEEGMVGDVFKNPKHVYTQQLLKAAFEYSSHESHSTS